MRPRMTAADIEAERLRMQEQWKKQGGNARAAAESSMAEIMTDDDIMSMMQEEQVGTRKWLCVRHGVVGAPALLAMLSLP
jgi:ABC-type microcin C transport system duplicated ATPase subunit YejF